MRDASTYRGNRRRAAHGLGYALELKWERKHRGMTRRQLDRERGEKVNPTQAFHTAAKASM